MAKIFKITEGLENMGGLRSGGQGSVYKARRLGEIITAVKLLPTPVYTESNDDKNYTSFINEVKKLERVNEQVNPHVVSILSHGITESGGFPYIEMEFIDGPDLEELLKPPREPIFTIRETVKLAEQLASALSHCHGVDVKHGDIKSNNIKYNVHTGNYVLLDFGLAVLSDEQRRTSLRQAGAVEFMAPEQSDGILLFESDIYGTGVILFELLAGQVPFPLNNPTDTARNKILLEHRETRPPDLISLRKEHLPAHWSEELKKTEMAVPVWLQNMIYKCLEKEPAKRFRNGAELLQYIHQHSHTSLGQAGFDTGMYALLEEKHRLLLENKGMKELLDQELTQRKEKERKAKRQGLLLLALPIILLLIILVLIFYPGLHSDHLALNAARPVQPRGVIGQYKVAVERAYFYSSPQSDAKQNAYLIPSNDVITSLNEEDGFIYTEFVSNDNEQVKGWLRQQDLVELEALVDKTNKLSNVHLNDADAEIQLRDARQSLANGQERRALYIYNYLAEQEVPEAMYQAGNMALQDRNEELDCEKGYELISRASEMGYRPAKTTLGFLFAFANDAGMLQLTNYQHCQYPGNLQKGAELLINAALEGDTTAKRWLKELNRRQRP